MARLVGRCLWCQRTVEVELALVAVERWASQLAARSPGRPPLPGVPSPSAERQRKYRERRRAREEEKARSSGRPPLPGGGGAAKSEFVKKKRAREEE